MALVDSIFWWISEFLYSSSNDRGILRICGYRILILVTLAPLPYIACSYRDGSHWKQKTKRDESK